MAKQLLLVRHAKSDWGNADLADFDRPLNNRGKQNAPEMAERLLKKGFKFDLLVSSPAKRALRTARYFAEAYGVTEIPTVKAIYEANTSTLLSIVNNFDDKAETIVLFGHNPSITDFANQLFNGSIYNVPTSGMVLISFPFDSWETVSPGTGDLIFFDYPKNSDEM